MKFIFQTVTVTNEIGGIDRTAKDGRCDHACLSRDANGLIIQDDSCTLYEVVGGTELCMGPRSEVIKM